jgi:hypothetical protein
MPRKYKILLRQGTGASVVPTAANFDIGEPAWNSTDGKLYIKNAAGAMVEVGNIPNGSITTAKLATPIDPSVSSLNGGPLDAMRNRIINGDMTIDQRNSGAAQTITAAAALAYTVDRWYAYCTGANVTGQQVQGATAGRFRYRFTGAASVTVIQFGQRIEQANSVNLAGTTATLSVDLANSLLTTVTWTAFYANTANSWGSIASPTRTQIATGTFTVNSTVTRYSTQISIPAAATTGIEIVLSVGAQTSGTWTIGDVQLEPGSIATPFSFRHFQTELAMCQRYYDRNIGEIFGGIANSNNNIQWFSATFSVEMRVTPSVTLYGNNVANSVRSSAGVTTSITSPFLGVSTKGLTFSTSSTATFSSGVVYQAGYIASAEF